MHSETNRIPHLDLSSETQPITWQVIRQHKQSEPAFAYSHILLIDDNDIDLLVNQRMVHYSRLSKTVTTTNSVDSAIAFLNGCTDISQLPQLIMLDLNMPEKSGFDFLNEYEKLDQLIKLTCTIVIVSSSDCADDLQRAFRYHYVSNYLVKPLNIMQLDKLKE